VSNLKKYGLIVIGFIVSLSIPVSVYAYNNSNSNLMLNNNYSSMHQQHHGNDEIIMQNHQWMHNLMSEDINCFNEQEHDAFIEKQRMIIEQKELSQELTREEADERLNDLEEMLSYHDQYHEDNNSSDDDRSGCH
jgi:nucleoside 2-deoxyribosyltransferase